MTPRRVTSRMSGSAFDPETGRTTTIIRGPNGSARMEEHGNRLGHHERVIQHSVTSRIFGSVFDPETGYATTAVQGPNGYARSVERRNGPRQPNRWERGYSRMSGSLYNPETGRTTTIVRGPNGEARSTEDGNRLGRSLAAGAPGDHAYVWFALRSRNRPDDHHHSWPEWRGAHDRGRATGLAIAAAWCRRAP